MFAVNKEARVFLVTNFISVKNEFINEGMIEYLIDSSYPFWGQIQFEKLYFEVIQRNVENRNLTINLYFEDDTEFYIFNETMKFIKAQEKQIKVKIKLKYCP
jgi:hypothetical protein